MDLDDTLPKAANKPRLVPARMFLRSGHKVRFREEVSKDSLMFALGEEYSAEAADEGWRAEGEWVRASPEQALVEVFEFAKRECYAICDPATWFENMRRSTLRRAASSSRYRDRI